ASCAQTAGTTTRPAREAAARSTRLERMTTAIDMEPPEKSAARVCTAAAEGPTRVPCHPCKRMNPWDFLDQTRRVAPRVLPECCGGATFARRSIPPNPPVSAWTPPSRACRAHRDGSARAVALLQPGNRVRGCPLSCPIAYTRAYELHAVPQRRRGACRLHRGHPRCTGPGPLPCLDRALPGQRRRRARPGWRRRARRAQG